MKKLGLKANPVRDAQGNEGREPAKFVVVKEMQMGPLRLKDAAFIVVDHGDLFSPSEQPFDGLIGATILAQFAMIVDAPQRRIVLISPGGLRAEEINRMGFGSDPVLKLEKAERRYRNFFDKPESCVQAGRIPAWHML